MSFVKFVFFIFVVASWAADNKDVLVSNLSAACYKCLCHVATRCDVLNNCAGGYCGPFNISRVYWVDAGRVTLEEDDPERPQAWIDCALNYYCALKIIDGYLGKFGRDCNGDGLTDCYDYMMINYNGGYGCSTPLKNSERGRLFLERYEECKVFL